MNIPSIRIAKYSNDLIKYRIGDIYTERKESGNESLPMLSVSIHSGVSDGELADEDLGKRVSRTEDKSQYKRAEKNDIVFNMMRAWQGAIGVVRTTGMVSPAYIVAKPNDTVYPLFMDYYMKNPLMINKIDRLSYGLMDFRKRLYWDSFTQIECYLPSVEEQRDICALFESIDSVISIIEREVLLWEEKRKGILQRLFSGNGELFNVGESMSKRIPLSTIVNTIPTSKAAIKNTAYKEYREGLFPAFSASGQDVWLEDYLYDGKGIVVSAVGARCGKAFKADGKWNVCANTHTLIVDEKFADRDYIWYLINNEAWWVKGGSAQPFIKVKESLARPHLLPSMNEQKKIVDCLASIDDVISLKKQKLETWQNIKKGLLQQMFV